ncbi:MAG: UbiD family decarboxylase [Betaproteobacteria bacterium]|nr:UbiD family decarboxylase [Betaproteobacteria bacterium]
MALRDTRSFLEKLQEAGELLVVDQEVDADAEAAAIVAKLNEDGGQAVWFRNVKGTTSGASLAGGLYAGPACSTTGHESLGRGSRSPSTSTRT